MEIKSSLMAITKQAAEKTAATVAAKLTASVAQQRQLQWQQQQKQSQCNSVRWFAPNNYYYYISFVVLLFCA